MFSSPSSSSTSPDFDSKDDDSVWKAEFGRDFSIVLDKSASRAIEDEIGMSASAEDEEREEASFFFLAFVRELNGGLEDGTFRLLYRVRVLVSANT